MHARNPNLRQLRGLTRRLGIAATVLVGIFAGLAAAATPGHHRRAIIRRSLTTPAAPAGHRAPPVPALPPLNASDEQAPASTPAPAPPSQPPAPTQAPPVVVTGGS